MPAGRPTGRDSGPIIRLKAWCWLSDVLDRAGVDCVRRLNASPITSGLARSDHFSSVLEDGTDPGRVVAGPAANLVQHVAAQDGFGSTKKTYHDTFWKMLQNYDEDDGFTEREREDHLDCLGMLLVERGNIDFVALMGFRPWRLNRAIAGSSVWLEIYGALPEFATLKTLAILLRLLRQAIARERAELATRLRLVLGLAAARFAMQFPAGEPRRAWEVVVRTRVLTWTPHFSPSPTTVSSCYAAQQDEFHTAEPTTGRGRPRQAPGTAASPRVQRRWQRRAIILAAHSELDRLPLPIFAFKDSATPSQVRAGWFLPSMAEIYVSPDE